MQTLAFGSRQLPQGIMFKPAAVSFCARYPKLTKRFSEFQSFFLSSGRVSYEDWRLARKYEKEERRAMCVPENALNAEILVAATHLIDQTTARNIRVKAYRDINRTARSSLFDDIRLGTSMAVALALIPIAVMAIKTLTQPISSVYIAAGLLATAFASAVIRITESLEKKLNHKDEHALQVAMQRKSIR